MQFKTTLIYLTGKAGIGKYTIAKELAKSHGFIICDNQLINNPIFELLQYDGYAQIPEFAWDFIARIRDEIFEFLKKHQKIAMFLQIALLKLKVIGSYMSRSGKWQKREDHFLF